MNKKIAVALAAFAAAVVPVVAMAQATPVGLWKSIDDKTGKERSLIRIAETSGVLTGRIEKSLDPDSDKSAVCDKCTDDRKGKPLIGMAIIRNVKQNADDKAIWDGGDITDPDNGKTYRLRLKPLDGGKQLEVRGYIGPFFRNQTWIRVE
jgi:uncharacterized protein (DUF2147 family)